MHQVIKRDRVRVQEEPAVRQATSAPQRHDASRVEVVRVHGRPVAIQLTCRCGEVSVLEIEYEDESNKEKT